MLSWLYRRNETYIEAFDFKPLKRIDRGDEALRRSTFTDEEVIEIKRELEKYIAVAKGNVDEEGNMSKVINGYYLLISIITGLRRGEQLQLKWSDIKWLEKNVKGQAVDDTYSLVKITVRKTEFCADFCHTNLKRIFVHSDNFEGKFCIKFNLL